MAQNELINLKNLGKTSVQWLDAVGIRTRAQLVDRGSVDIYRLVKSRGFRANRVLLYSLHAAILDIHWSELDPGLKASLISEAERA